MTRKERFKNILDYFRQHQPNAETELVFRNPYELMVAVILSAQCTDKRVNIITPPFFVRYPTTDDLAASSPNEIFEYIKSCSYPNNKAKNLHGMAVKLVQDYEGIIPEEPEELQKLPGVGRKTANVIASVVFHKPAMAVDTHVFRVSARLGLTSNAKTPLQTEMQLLKYIPSKELHIAHHWLILHGRYVCQARKPRCNECGLSSYCLFFKKNSKIA
jgi:endonuclease III